MEIISLLANLRLPKIFIKWLTKVVQKEPKTSYFIFELPLGLSYPNSNTKIINSNVKVTHSTDYQSVTQKTFSSRILLVAVHM